MLFKNPTIHPEHTKKIATKVQVFTNNDEKLEPGKYWVGSLESVFPPTNNPTSPLSLILDTLDSIDASNFSGVIVTHGETEVSFLVAPVQYSNTFKTQPLDKDVVSAPAKEFKANSYIIMIPRSDDIFAYGKTSINPNQRAIVNVLEPVTPATGLNYIALLRDTQEGAKTVFQIMPNDKE